MTKLLVETEQNKYSEFIYNILLEKLFESGGELRKLLVEKFNVSDAYARKIIERAARTRDIKSSKPYTFGKGQYIYLLPDQDLDVRKIKLICLRKRPPLYRLLQAMGNNGGIISYYEALKITASPDLSSSTKVNTLQDMLKILIKLELVYEKKDTNGIIYIVFRDDLNKDSISTDNKLMTQHYSKMVIDSSLMPDIIRWLAKSNLIDNVNAIYRNKKTPSMGARQNGLYWDAYSYSKATGINPILGSEATTVNKQTLVVLDVVLSDDYGQLDLDGFLARVQININAVQAGVRKVMPIVIYKTCTEEVLNKLKKLGFLAFDIGSIFGTRIYTILKKLKEVNDLLLADQTIERSVNEVLKVIRSAGQEDALKDLRGVLFEVLMFPVLKSIYSSANAVRGKTYSVQHDDGKKEGYEYDYIFNSSNPEEIIVVELKGYNSSVSIGMGDKNKKGTLKWFFERTLPFAREQFKKEIADGRRFKGVYITTAYFWQDGKDYIAGLNKSKFKSVEMDVAYDRTALLKLLKKKNFHKEIELIKEYYTKEEEV